MYSKLISFFLFSQNSLMYLACSSGEQRLNFPGNEVVSLSEQLVNIRSCLTSQDKVGGGRKCLVDEGVPDMAFKGIDGLSVDLFMGYGNYSSNIDSTELLSSSLSRTTVQSLRNNIP